MIDRPTELMIHIGGGFYVNLDQNVEPYHWMFALTGDGVPYTLRQATGHEVNLANQIRINLEGVKVAPNDHGLRRLFENSQGGIISKEIAPLVASGAGGVSVVELRAQIERLQTEAIRSHALLVESRAALKGAPGNETLVLRIKEHLNTSYTLSGTKL